MSNRPRKDLLEFRRKASEERVEAWRALSPQEQLAVIDKRLGEGVGAKKERAAIAKRIQEAKANG